MIIADMIAPCGLDCSICKRALPAEASSVSTQVCAAIVAGSTLVQ